VSEEVLAVIARLSFRAAKPFTRWGKPQIPHEYTVRNPEVPEAEQNYVALWNAIDAGGVIERFGRYRRRYLYPGDGRKYWFMSQLYDAGGAVHSTIINRMLIEDDLARLRREGQLDAVAYGTAHLARLANEERS